MDKPMFSKKGHKPSEDEILAAVVPKGQKITTHNTPGAEPTVKGGTGDDGATVRLSCDIARSRHRALRVAAANCDMTIVEMVETLIDRHLVSSSIQEIVSAYHKKRACSRPK